MDYNLTHGSLIYLGRVEGGPEYIAAATDGDYDALIAALGGDAVVIPPPADHAERPYVLANAPGRVVAWVDARINRPVAPLIFLAIGVLAAGYVGGKLCEGLVRLIA
jgi:hypothetical protein